MLSRRDLWFWVQWELNYALLTVSCSYMYQSWDENALVLCTSFFINPYLKLLITEHEDNFLHKVRVCSIFTILIGWVCCCSKKSTLNSILSIKLDLTNKTFTHKCVIPSFSCLLKCQCHCKLYFTCGRIFFLIGSPFLKWEGFWLLPKT